MKFWTKWSANTLWLCWRSTVVRTCLVSLVSIVAPCTGAYAASVLLTWEPPTENTDGSPLTDLFGYRLLSGCSQSGQYERPLVTIGPASSYVLDGLPDNGTCYFALRALNVAGVASELSNEAVKSFVGVLPGAPTVAPTITWQETTLAITASGTPTTGASAATTVTFSWTAPGNANEVLLVSVGTRHGVGATSSITGITFNTVPMNEVIQVQNTTTRLCSGLFWLPAPASGAHDVVVTITGTSIEFLKARAFGIQGAHQSELDTTGTSSTATVADGISHNHTVVNSGAWIFSTAASNTGTIPTQSRTLDQAATAGSDDFFGTQYDASGTTGAVAVGWSGGDAGQGWAQATGSFKVADAGGGAVIPAAWEYYARLRQ